MCMSSVALKSSSAIPPPLLLWLHCSQNKTEFVLSELGLVVCFGQTMSVIYGLLSGKANNQVQVCEPKSAKPRATLPTTMLVCGFQLSLIGWILCCVCAQHSCLHFWTLLGAVTMRNPITTSSTKIYHSTIGCTSVVSSLCSKGPVSCKPLPVDHFTAQPYACLLGDTSHWVQRVAYSISFSPPLSTAFPLQMRVERFSLSPPSVLNAPDGPRYYLGDLIAGSTWLNNHGFHDPCEMTRRNLVFAH